MAAAWSPVDKNIVIANEIDNNDSELITLLLDNVELFDSLDDHEDEGPSSGQDRQDRFVICTFITFFLFQVL